jgi:hypothetical protein
MTRSKHTTASIVVLGIVGLLALHGCGDLLGPFIHGGSNNYYAKGQLTTLRVASPEDKVVVVALYPVPVDRSWSPGVGHSGNFNDDTSMWEEYQQVRYRKAGEWKILTIKWQYSARTRILRVGDATCDVPKGKVAVISFDDDGKPTCSISDRVPETIGTEKQERDREMKKSQPALPSRDAKD